MSTDPSLNFFAGRHAALYDLFYAGKPYAEEAKFIHECLQKYSALPVNRILELACGTGSHSLQLEKYGYEIIATDCSRDMLAQARQKAAREKSNVVFREQDMRALDVPERPFDAIVCLFDSIGYVKTNASILQTLNNVAAHLRPGGLFIFEFWHAGAMIRGYDPIRVRRWQTQEGEILRISETRIDLPSQLCHVAYSIYECNHDGRYVRLQETHINRFFLLQEMALFLSQAGLHPLRWFSGFHEAEGIDESTWHIVAIASLPGGKDA